MKHWITGALLTFSAASAFAQTATLTCNSPLAPLNTSSANGWEVSPPSTSPTPVPTTFNSAVNVAPVPPYNNGTYDWVSPVPYANASYVSLRADAVTVNPPAGVQNYYGFRKTFTLDAAALPTFALNYDTLVDDDVVEVYVNGVAQGISRTGFSPTTPFPMVPNSIALTNNWQVGTNEMVFVVRDYGGWTGLLLHSVAPTVVCAPVAAVPATDLWALFGLAGLLAGVGAWQVRRRKV